MTQSTLKIDGYHGSPHDRGRADFYYHRLPRPNKTVPYYTRDLTDDEITEYHRGYREAEEIGIQKDFY